MTNEQETYNKYLDELRESGVTNMFGASTYLEAEFDLPRKQAQVILLEWMHTFTHRHPKVKTGG